MSGKLNPKPKPRKPSKLPDDANEAVKSKIIGAGLHGKIIAPKKNPNKNAVT